MISDQSFTKEGNVDVGYGRRVSVGLSSANGEDIRVIRANLFGSHHVNLRDIGKLGKAVLSYRRQTGWIAQQMTKRGSFLVRALTRNGRLVGRGSGLEFPIGVSVLDGCPGKDALISERGTNVRLEWKKACSNTVVSSRDVRTLENTPTALDELVGIRLCRLASDALEGLAKAIFDSGSEGRLEGLGCWTGDRESLVGAIDPASCPAWRNPTALIAADAGDLADAIAQRLKEHLGTLRDPHEKPDLIVMSRKIYPRFMDSKLVSVNHENGRVSYKGILVEAYDYCPRDRVYALNTRYLGLIAHEEQNFIPDECLLPDRMAVALILRWAGNLVVTSRRLQLVILLEGI